MSSVVLIVLSNDSFLYFYCFCFQMKKYTFGALIQPQRTKKGLVVVLEFMSNLLSADLKKINALMTFIYSHMGTFSTNCQSYASDTCL